MIFDSVFRGILTVNKPITGKYILDLFVVTAASIYYLVYKSRSVRSSHIPVRHPIMDAVFIRLLNCAREQLRNIHPSYVIFVYLSQFIILILILVHVLRGFRKLFFIGRIGKGVICVTSTHTKAAALFLLQVPILFLRLLQPFTKIILQRPKQVFLTLFLTYYLFVLLLLFLDITGRKFLGAFGFAACW